MLGRRVQADICSRANYIVKNYIFPELRGDEIIRPLRYDELTIIYANKMSVKYPKPMIGSKIRLIGRILNQVKKYDSNVQQFADLFRPQLYELTIKAIQAVAGLDTSSQHYKSPSTASAAGRLSKKCADFYIAKLIQKNDLAKISLVENFLKLLVVDFSVSINKTVLETQIKNKSLKKVVLPSISDIKCLNRFLNSNRQKYFELLQHSFNIIYFKELQKFTLASVQVFNRSRAGEVQRLKHVILRIYRSWKITFNKIFLGLLKKPIIIEKSMPVLL